MPTKASPLASPLTGPGPGSSSSPPGHSRTGRRSTCRCPPAPGPMAKWIVKVWWSPWSTIGLVAARATVLPTGPITDTSPAVSVPGAMASLNVTWRLDTGPGTWLAGLSESRAGRTRPRGRCARRRSSACCRDSRPRARTSDTPRCPRRSRPCSAVGPGQTRNARTGRARRTAGRLPLATRTHVRPFPLAYRLSRLFEVLPSRCIQKSSSRSVRPASLDRSRASAADSYDVP